MVTTEAIKEAYRDGAQIRGSVGRIKHLRQERADIENQIAEFQGVGNYLLDNPKNDDGTLDPDQNAKFQAIEKDVAVNKDRLAQVNEMIRRYEVMERVQTDRRVVQSAEQSEFPNSDSIPTVPRSVKTPRVFGSLGQQLIAVRNASLNLDQGASVNKLMALNAAILGANESVGADGGFLLQEEFANTIFRYMFEQGAVFSRVNRVPISGNSIKFPAIDESSRATGSRGGGVRAYFIPEGGVITSSRPKLRMVTFTLHDLAALGYATNDLLEDVPGMSNFFMGEFEKELTWAVENAIINGLGTADPLGIATALDSATLGPTVTQAVEVGQTLSDPILPENINNMWARLLDGADRNAVWYINRDLLPELDNMAMALGTGGTPVYLPAGGLSATPFASLKGKPVITIEQTAAVGTVGDIILADMGGYTLVDKGGMRSDSSMHVAFDSNQMAFRIIYRLDGKPMMKEAITPANSTTKRGPFVVLGTRS